MFVFIILQFGDLYWRTQTRQSTTHSYLHCTLCALGLLYPMWTLYGVSSVAETNISRLRYGKFLQPLLEKHSVCIMDIFGFDLEELKEGQKLKIHHCSILVQGWGEQLQGKMSSLELVTIKPPLQVRGSLGLPYFVSLKDGHHQLYPLPSRVGSTRGWNPDLLWRKSNLKGVYMQTTTCSSIVQGSCDFDDMKHHNSVHGCH